MQRFSHNAWWLAFFSIKQNSWKLKENTFSIFKLYSTTARALRHISLWVLCSPSLAFSMLRLFGNHESCKSEFQRRIFKEWKKVETCVESESHRIEESRQDEISIRSQIDRATLSFTYVKIFCITQIMDVPLRKWLTCWKMKDNKGRYLSYKSVFLMK